jgi:hypothetical protein
MIDREARSTRQLDEKRLEGAALGEGSQAALEGFIFHRWLPFARAFNKLTPCHVTSR